MRRLVFTLLVAGALAGCNRNTPPPPAGTQGTAKAAGQEEAVKPAVPAEAASPAGQGAAPSAAGQVNTMKPTGQADAMKTAGQEEGTNAEAQAGGMKGRILERLDASPYTYLRLQVGGQEVWAAVPATAAQVGQDVTLLNPMEMNNFESKTLKRTFPSVLFATVSGEAGGAGGGMGGGMGGSEAGGMGGGAGSGMGGDAGSASGLPPGHPQINSATDVGDVKTEKASGADARTVAEAFAQKDALSEKPVLIRGKVVKFNAGILGKNWIHLRDGSGSADGKNNDITVTTDETVAKGDVVTIRGTLRLDKDFGAGYSYPVIIEDAKLQK